MQASPTHLPIRPDWLATTTEPALDPAQPVIDSHHHLYDRPGIRYLLDDYLADIGSGHNVRGSVFVQARAMTRASGPEALKGLGETEFVNGVAAMSASGIYGQARVCAAIAGGADLTLGAAVRPVLERHIAAAGGWGENPGRFRGIRHTLTWDADPGLMNPAYVLPRHLAADAAFRRGFAELAPLGLSYEAWAFFHQLHEVADLARAFPETPVVVNHCGGVIGIAGYTGRRAEVFEVWKPGIIALAACPNVSIKLSGLGMRLAGFGFENQPRAPGSAQLAEAWRPWMETCLEAFGAGRCMFGSNFPVDKGGMSFSNGLNAVKRLLEPASPTERHAVLYQTARDFYRMDLPGDGTF